MAPCVEVRFTRSNKKDDIIKVQKIETDWYSVLYKDKDSKKSYEFQCTYDEFLEYLEIAFDFVSFDQIDPYDGVQFSIPNYPLVYCTLRRLRNKRFKMTLWKVFNSIRDEYWPTFEETSDVEMD